MSDTVIRIDKLENGYEVEICDPEIMKNNEKPKSEYKSPWKAYAFTTAEEVVEFVGKQLVVLKPPPDAEEEYDTAFKQATKED